MDIGTSELIDEPKKVKLHRSGTSGGKGPGGGHNPGNGGDGPDGDSDPSQQMFIPDKSRILTGFVLLVVLMTFAGLIAAYVVIYTNNVGEWQPFNLPVPVWISTALIFFSSLVYHFGKKAVDRNDQLSAKKWFLATTVIGAAFISSQMLAWLALNARGLYMRGNPYAGFFYLLTAVHAIHVIGGIIALGTVLLKSFTSTNLSSEIARRRTLAEVVGWYWHFMGFLWLVLVILLGFFK